MTSTYRIPTAEELARIDDELAALREHFHEWTNYEPGQEHELVGFALYEHGGSECCSETIERAAPFALCSELVAVAGFSWVMLEVGDESHYGIMHPLLAAPIDLETLEDGAYNRQTYTDDPTPGERTHDSARFILFLAAWRDVFGDEPVPDGDIDSLDAQFAARGKWRPEWYMALESRHI